MKDSGAPLLSQHPVFLVNSSVNDGHSCSIFTGLEYPSHLTPLIFSLLPCPPSALSTRENTEDAQRSIHYAFCHDG